MQASNDQRSYGWVARFFHWTIAALIIAAICLGLYAGALPRGTQDQIAAIFAAFSIHKTVGVAVLFLAVLRIIWTLTQTKPRPLHPNRKVEMFLADAVHWAMWAGMIIMPLTGWIVHSAAPGGFSRILWPFGQRLPMVPESAALAERFGSFHETGWWVLAGLIVLHVAGAIKHALIDRDGTLIRMAGPHDRAPEPPADRPAPMLHLLAPIAALLIWGVTVAVSYETPETGADLDAAQTEAPAPALAPTATTIPTWAVQSGALGIEVAQSGSPVSGQFGTWKAQIAYDPDSQSGTVDVTIDIASLQLGAISDSATGPDFLNASAHPQATFQGTITPAADGENTHLARGQLTIAGKTMPATLPFSLQIDGDAATAKGRINVNRLDYGVGTGYADESTAGFTVKISFDLTAKRQ